MFVPAQAVRTRLLIRRVLPFMQGARSAAPWHDSCT